MPPNEYGVELDANGNPVDRYSPPPAVPSGTTTAAPSPAAPPAPSSIYTPAPSIFTTPDAGTMPGIGEKVGADTAEKLGQPSPLLDAATGAASTLSGQGAGSQYWNGVQGQFNQPQNTSNWSEAYGMEYYGTSPSDMSAYYDNAVNQAGQDIRRQGAAAGNLGSSATGGRIGAAVTDIRSQQARDQAEYDLNRARLLGDFAAQADATNRLNSANELSWLQGGASIAGAAGQEDIVRVTAQISAALGISEAETTRLLAGMSVAERAQLLQRSREDAGLAALGGYTGAATDVTGEHFDTTISADQATMDQIWNLLLGQAQQGLITEAQAKQAFLDMFGITAKGAEIGLTAGGFA